MVRREEITPAMVRELFDYDPCTGRLTYLWRSRKWFISAAVQKRWNSNWADRKDSINGKFYARVTILGHRFYTHIVAWAHYYGRWPTYDVDHKNRDGFDNTIWNMRDVPHRTNNRNLTLSKRNKSGYPGVYEIVPGEKFLAQIVVDGKTKHIGHYPSKPLAIEARKRAEAKHGFSTNHHSKRKQDT